MKTFNLVVTGYGGQGVLTVANITAKAAFRQGYDIKEAELHGLAQKGGSLNCHVRFGKGILSPLVPEGQAQLIIALEGLEALRACYWAGPDTTVIVNSKTFKSPLSFEKILAKIRKTTKKVYAIDADGIVRKETGSIINVNMFLLGYALGKSLLPLKKESILQEIKEKIKPKFLEKTMLAFERGLQAK